MSESDLTINREFNIKQVREHDLLLLTTEKIPKVDNDIKRVANIEFMRSLLVKSCAMFAFVTQRAGGAAKKGAPANDLASIEINVDLSKSCFLQMEERERSFSKFYVYHYESLATTFREYRTLRMSEFYGMSEVLVDPHAQEVNRIMAEESKVASQATLT